MGIRIRQRRSWPVPSAAEKSRPVMVPRLFDRRSYRARPCRSEASVRRPLDQGASDIRGSAITRAAKVNVSAAPRFPYITGYDVPLAGWSQSRCSTKNAAPSRRAARKFVRKSIKGTLGRTSAGRQKIAVKPDGSGNPNCPSMAGENRIEPSFTARTGLFKPCGSSIASKRCSRRSSSRATQRRRR
jgi:hypothetical protein